MATSRGYRREGWIPASAARRCHRHSDCHGRETADPERRSRSIAVTRARDRARRGCPPIDLAERHDATFGATRDLTFAVANAPGALIAFHRDGHGAEQARRVRWPRPACSTRGPDP